MDNVLRKSRSIHNNRVFKEDMRNSYFKHQKELSSIANRPRSMSAFSLQRRSQPSQEQTRIGRENALFVNKLAAVAGSVNSFRRAAPIRLSSGLKSRRRV